MFKLHEYVAERGLTVNSSNLDYFDDAHFALHHCSNKDKSECMTKE